MGLVFSRLLVQSLQNFIGVGVYIEIHLFVVVFNEIVRIGAEFLIDFLFGFDIISLSRDDVDNQMLEGSLL